MPVLDDNEQVLHGTTCPVIVVCKFSSVPGLKDSL